MACEGRASGVSCRVRRPIWQPIGYPAAPMHPPHAIGTRGPLGDQIISIEASFDFSVQRSLKYPHVRPQMGNFATASRRESDPFPPARSRGVQRDSLGPRIRNCRNTSASGWELESQISPCVDIVTDILLITVVYWKHSSSVKGMSVLKSDYALGQHAVPVSLELA